MKGHPCPERRERSLADDTHLQVDAFEPAESESGLPPAHTLDRPARQSRVPARYLLPLIVACALFMENLDSTVLSTSLPAIAADFGESPIRLKLALTSYLLALAVALPASG